MKKNRLAILACMCMMATLPACKDFLNTEPSDSLPTDKVLSEYSLLPSAINGLYDGLQGNSRSTAYYAAMFPIAGDLMGDDVQGVPTGSRVSSYYKMSYTKSNAPGIWYKAYNTLRRANRLIEMCDKLTNASPSTSQATQIKSARAQALAVRALVHFDLCRQYATPYPFSNDGKALGVPILVTIPENKSTPGRATLGEVYTQIISDFKEAIASNALSETDYGFISLYAAKALLARVYLYMGTSEGNTEALRLCKEVIESGKYELASTVSEYKTIWSEPGSKEMIFSIVNFDTKDWADREGLAYIYSVNGYYDAHITKKFYEEMLQDPDDIRWNVLWPSEGTNATGAIKGVPEIKPNMKIFIGKYPGKAAYKDMRSNDIPVIRLAEVYLNAAEAAFKLNDKATAQTYLNTIVKRANGSKSVALADVTLERILLERAKELVGEGHRFFDLMRNGLQCERFYGGVAGWHGTLDKKSQSFDHTYFRTILPIPEAELDVNPTLAQQQNPGY
ncbi:RagB/SusD family nutrient uptake outer membrane protein [Porphyromonas catoniae]|uniref:RagB/SusD family nutrient uptake outer membrane protein n=1 Tax=Porphyromonas catoniae TaxID=41976 RepID=UPI0023F12106|nr:RagB/SusD family nutrient uptake outer membrane protein [Porphyromonas catoniae]